MGSVRLILLIAAGMPRSGAYMQRAAAVVARAERTRAGTVRAQFGFKVQKSERLLIREAWEKADAYRPGAAIIVVSCACLHVCMRLPHPHVSSRDGAEGVNALPAFLGPAPPPESDAHTLLDAP